MPARPPLPAPKRWRGVPEPPDPVAARSPFWLALFRYWLHFLFWRRFSAVRLSRGCIPEPHAGRPLVIYTNHPSWWDPALLLLASAKLFPARTGFGPMEAAQLRRYGMFRKFGVFPVAPGPAGARDFLRQAAVILRHPNAMLAITAEGRFTDPRARPLTLRPGIAHLARAAPHAVFLPLALDYAFWNESRPEALLRFGAPVPTAGLSLRESQAALTAALTQAMDALAADSATRDPTRFATMLNGTAGAGLLYDSWRRARAYANGQRFSPRHETPPP
jgi:1-acyl-sn-glycerol-3-phosphate acyltransferase